MTRDERVIAWIRTLLDLGEDELTEPTGSSDRQVARSVEEVEERA